MKKAFLVIPFFLCACFLLGQAKEKKTEKNSDQIKTWGFSETQDDIAGPRGRTRRLDETRPNFISIRGGFVSGLLSTKGGAFTISFERPFRYTPLRWHVGFSVGETSKGEESDVFIPTPLNLPQSGSSEEAGRLEIQRLALHYGVNLYPCGFNRSWKPYIGAGLFVGGIEYDMTYNNEVGESDRSFMYGLHGTTGVRWARGLTRFGIEYRGGFMQANMYKKERTAGYHEFNFLIGFQF